MNGGRVHYARNGDVRLAYRVFGDSGPTMVYAPGWVVSNVDTVDETGSPYKPLIDRVSQRVRFVMWDRRGTGLSDPASHHLSFDERVADLRAVVDAVGIERFHLVGSSEGGSIAILFAAMYPDRVLSLGLYGTAARFSQDLPSFPWGFTPTEVDSHLDEIDRAWGEGALADVFYGSAAATPGVREMFGRYQRTIASPMMAKLRWRAFMDIDVRGVLASVRAPTLVMGRPGDGFVPIEAVAALAAAIPNASFHALPEGSHNGFDVIEELGEQMLEFIGEEQPTAAAERVLKTVVFTDIVRSTERLTAHGDAHWRHLLDTHDELVALALSRHDGERANHTGDGIFALFEAPTKAARWALDVVPALATRGMPIRAGIHTGECERRGTEWSGLAVHIGARIGALAGAGDILASRTVRDLSAGSGLSFESLGAQRLKGLPDEIEVYRVSAR
ncbi:adenylate/guanylate cyclase domain-containing protein [Mycobacterium sp. JS623]|uniref:adenylate/guanylate cyclase domain-containing protein n=1 Tax=Mycobacterium sp. JS623 TaxID=212767 RepID=UPI00059CF0E0|nr:adenylate/guanylate cyclase domain-containing protein [Mycobacterium sp. JS623]